MNKKKILIVIDVQNDFVYGNLGSNEAIAVVPNIVKKVNKYRTNDDFIIFTKDEHSDNYLNTQEGKKLPIKHCISNTTGCEIISELKTGERFRLEQIIRKDTFGYHWDYCPWIGILCGFLAKHLTLSLNKDNYSLNDLKRIKKAAEIDQKYHSNQHKTELNKI